MDAYAPIKQIGKGAYGTVSLVRRKVDGKILVWKELNYGQMSEKEKELVVSEVNILRELRHPYIIRYYDRIINKATTKLYIVMEYCENGDLAQLIKRGSFGAWGKRDGMGWRLRFYCVYWPRGWPSCSARPSGVTWSALLCSALLCCGVLRDPLLSFPLLVLLLLLVLVLLNFPARLQPIALRH